MRTSTRVSCSRQEGRPENEVPDQEVIESEKHEADVGALIIEFEKHQRQSLQLFQIEHAQVRRASRDEQGNKLKEATESRNSASHQVEKRRE